MKNHDARFQCRPADHRLRGPRGASIAATIVLGMAASAVPSCGPRSHPAPAMVSEKAVLASSAETPQSFAETSSPVEGAKHPPEASPVEPSSPRAASRADDGRELEVESPAPIPFGPGMTRPTLVSSAPIVYSSEALAANVSGLVLAKCTITIDGAVRDCRIVKGLPYLDQAALEVLATFRYSPATYRGRPLAVKYIMVLRIEPPPPKKRKD